MRKNKAFLLAASLISAALLFCGCTAAKTQAEPLGAYSFTDSLRRYVSVEYGAKAAACSGSLAQCARLSGMELIAATQDAWELDGLELDGVIDLGSLKNPSAELLLESGADIIIMSANTPGQLELENVLISAGMTVAYFDARNFYEYLDMLKIFTDISENSENYDIYGQSVLERVETAKAAAKGKESPRVLLLRAYSVGVKAKGSDNIAGEMLKDLGCTNISDSEKSLLEDLSMEKILEEDPEFIFVTTMGDDDGAIKSFESSIKAHPAFETLTAVKKDRVYILEKELFHNKPNHKWGESYEILSEILYGK